MARKNTRHKRRVKNLALICTITTNGYSLGCGYII